MCRIYCTRTLAYTTIRVLVRVARKCKLSTAGDGVRGAGEAGPALRALHLQALASVARSAADGLAPPREAAAAAVGGAVRAEHAALRVVPRGPVQAVHRLHTQVRALPQAT